MKTLIATAATIVSLVMFSATAQADHRDDFRRDVFSDIKRVACAIGNTAAELQREVRLLDRSGHLASHARDLERAARRVESAAVTGCNLDNLIRDVRKLEVIRCQLDDEVSEIRFTSYSPWDRGHHHGSGRPTSTREARYLLDQAEGQIAQLDRLVCEAQRVVVRRPSVPVHPGYGRPSYGPRPASPQVGFTIGGFSFQLGR